MTSAPVIPLHRTARTALLLLLLVSAVLRIAIAVRGGQYYWSDENRYHSSQAVVAALAEHQWAEAARHALSSTDYLGFRFLGLVPATVERLFWPAVEPPRALAAIFFGLFSVGSIALVWWIVRRTHGEEVTATWAAFFYAACVSGFYFTRHYFPYDPAIFFFLLSFAVGQGRTSPGRAFWVGACASAGFLTYNGYWNLGAVILVGYTFGGERTARSVLVRGASAGLGLGVPILGLVWLARLCGFDLIAYARAFSGTIVLGDFGKGWRLIYEYYRDAERGFAVLVLVLLAGSVLAHIRQRRAVPGGSWLAMGIVLCGVLILFSDVVQTFAVGGRMIKPLGLLFAVAAGITWARRPVLRGRRADAVMVGMVLLLAGANFRRPLAQVFPDRFRMEADARVREREREQPGEALGLLNARCFSDPVPLPSWPDHDVLMQAPHPLQFRPYLYEGYLEAARARFAASDLTMRLVRFKPRSLFYPVAPGVEDLLGGYAGVVELRLRVPRDMTYAEPLLVSGIPGRGDLISLRRVEPGKIVLEHDCWDVGLRRSETIDVSADPDAVHRLVLSIGSLLPPEDHPFWRLEPELRPLRGRWIAEWDGKVVANREDMFHPAAPATIAVGTNPIGGTTMIEAYSGAILSKRRLHPRVASRWGFGGMPAIQERETPPGPVRMVFQPEAAGVARREPLLAATRGSDSILVELEQSPEGSSFIVRRRGAEVARSTPLQLGPGPHQMDFLCPLLDPAAAAWAPLRGVSSLLVNGKRVLFFPLEFGGDTAGTEPLFLWDAGSDWPVAGASAARTSLQIREARPLGVEARPALEWTVGDVEPERKAGIPPGVLTFRVRFPSLPAGTSEPLLVTGRPGIGDALYLLSEANGTFRIGHDHWGSSLLISAPFSVDLSAVHVLRIRIDAPEVDLSDGRSKGEKRTPSGTLWVSIDGQEILSAPRAWFPASRREAVAGWNSIGSTVCGPRFSGEILSLSCAP